MKDSVGGVIAATLGAILLMSVGYGIGHKESCVTVEPSVPSTIDGYDCVTPDASGKNLVVGDCRPPRAPQGDTSYHDPFDPDDNGWTYNYGSPCPPAYCVRMICPNSDSR